MSDRWAAKCRLAIALAVPMLLGPAGGAIAAASRNATHGAGGRRSAANGETIVFFRHGEKPANGLGQLDCQGLNRALQLPAVLEKKFGKPYIIFAPDPADKVSDGGKDYYYVRPLATIEPTAIKFGMPVDTAFGYSQIAKLQSELLNSKYQSDLIFVVWEHKKMIELVQDIVKQGGGDPSKLPAWPDSEFDMILVVHVTQNGATFKATWDKEAEGLNGQSTQCPSK